MRRLLAAALLSASLAIPVAAAAPQQASTPRECIERVTAGRTTTGGLPRCTRTEPGQWLAQFDDRTTTSPGTGFFGALIVFALFWSLIPVIGAYSIASNNGQSVGIAVLLGIFLGWVGLLIVYLMGRNDTRAGMHTVVDALGPQRTYDDRPARTWTPPPATPARPAAPAAAPPAAPARRPSANEIKARLSRLEALKESGAITQREYAAKRKAILDEV